MPHPPIKLTAAQVKEWIENNPGESKELLKQLNFEAVTGAVVHEKDVLNPVHEKTGKDVSDPVHEKTGKDVPSPAPNTHAVTSPGHHRKSSSETKKKAPQKSMDIPQFAIEAIDDEETATMQLKVGKMDLYYTLKSIMEIVTSVISADRCSIFLYDKVTNELYTYAFDIGGSSEKPTAQKDTAASDGLFQSRGKELSSRDKKRLESSADYTVNSNFVDRAKRMADAMHRKSSSGAINTQLKMRVPIDSGLIGYVARHKTPLNVKDAYEDPRFNPTFDRMTGYRTKEVLCHPIFSPDVGPDGKNELLGVANLINKKPVNGEHEFTSSDQRVFESILQMVGISILAATAFESAQKAELEAVNLAVKVSNLYQLTQSEMAKSELLLKLAKLLYSETNVAKITSTIVNTAKEIMMADKASVFIADHDANELYSTVFDNGTEQKIVCSMDKGIAGYCARTGQTVNLANAYDDPRFNPSVDILTNYKTVSLICVPLFGIDTRVIGVATLINKTNEKIDVFTKEDQKVFEEIAVFCGLALSKALMMHQIDEQRNRLEITMNLMTYHANVTKEELTAFKNKEPALLQDLGDIKDSFYDLHQFSYNDDHLAALVHKIFTDLKYEVEFDILDDKLIHYLLVVRRNYRPIAYHNFAHASGVTHAVYCWIQSGILDEYMDKIDLFSMLIAALNHDIDHRGTNNQFQKLAGTDLARFYQNSTMERHHFNHAMGIINSTQGLDILSKMKKDDYKRSLKVIESSILMTDLSLFFTNQKQLLPLLKNDQFDPKNNVQHKELMRGVIMTCADLSAMFKPWEASRKTADLVYEELFIQGDQEQALGLPYSSELTDRRNAGEIPRMQVGFYNFVVMPAFETFRDMFKNQNSPLMQTQIDTVFQNKLQWEKLKESKVTYKMGA